MQFVVQLTKNCIQFDAKKIEKINQGCAITKEVKPGAMENILG